MEDTRRYKIDKRRLLVKMSVKNEQQLQRNRRQRAQTAEETNVAQSSKQGMNLIQNDVEVTLRSKRSRHDGKINKRGKNYICPVCLGTAENDVVECGNCEAWHHFTCVGLQDKKHELHDIDWACKTCMMNENVPDDDVLADDVNSLGMGTSARETETELYTSSDHEHGDEPCSTTKLAPRTASLGAA